MDGQPRREKLGRQLILRVEDPQVAAMLRRMIRQKKHTLMHLDEHKNPHILMDDHRHGRFVTDGHELKATLVDLPCVVESQKTFDQGKTYYKSADIHQMLVVQPKQVDKDAAGDADADSGQQGIPKKRNRSGPDKPMSGLLAPAIAYPSGLTPPAHNIRPNRFERFPPPAPALIRKVEERLNHSGKKKVVVTEFLSEWEQPGELEPTKDEWEDDEDDNDKPVPGKPQSDFVVPQSAGIMRLRSRRRTSPGTGGDLDFSSPPPVSPARGLPSPFSRPLSTSRSTLAGIRQSPLPARSPEEPSFSSPPRLDPPFQSRPPASSLVQPAPLRRPAGSPQVRSSPSPSSSASMQMAAGGQAQRHPFPSPSSHISAPSPSPSPARSPSPAHQTSNLLANPPPPRQTNTPRRGAATFHSFTSHTPQQSQFAPSPGSGTRGPHTPNIFSQQTPIISSQHTPQHSPTVGAGAMPSPSFGTPYPTPSPYPYARTPGTPSQPSSPFYPPPSSVTRPQYTPPHLPHGLSAYPVQTPPETVANSAVSARKQELDKLKEQAVPRNPMMRRRRAQRIKDLESELGQ